MTSGRFNTLWLFLALSDRRPTSSASPSDENLSSTPSLGRPSTSSTSFPDGDRSHPTTSPVSPPSSSIGPAHEPPPQLPRPNMATVAQCVFCFEVLSAELEKRKKLSLVQCEELWDKYQAHLGAGKDVEVASGSDDEQADDEDLDDSDAGRLPRTLRPDGISRLQAESPASGSGKSTPSSDSSSSSSTLFSAASKASSKSSFFSFARKSPVRAEPEYPVFVTWNEINARGGKSLRGCVGTFEGAPLAQNLETYSITSAFNDHRFAPITASELPRLRCSLTLLTHFTPCDSPLDWSLGTHGLRISFTHHGRRYGATYLPDVAPEQGWTKEETVVSLMRKAGWNGSRRDWTRVSDLTAVRYEGDKASIGWEEYKAWRDWVRVEKLG